MDGGVFQTVGLAFGRKTGFEREGAIRTYSRRLFVISEKELERLTNVEGFEDLFYYAMDYIDRLIENDEEIPEDMRKLARFLEAQDDYYKW